jgi:hypothetical protein
MRLRLFVAACLAAFLLAGCAGSGSTTGPSGDASAGFPDGYQRIVTPSFPVVDSTGARLGHPFFGGLNVPRPQVVDIDQDGDLDLFLQERAGQITFFERVSAGDSTRLVWRTDRYQGLEIGEWFRFADLDQDGDLDMLAERPYSYIRVYRNVGSPSNPDFTLFADSLRRTDGTPIFSDRQNIPTVTDLDCNGRLDLFLGRLDGTITRFEARGDSAGIPRFSLVTEQFEGIEIVNQQMASARHGANTMAFGDADGDGDLDLFWGDFFEPGLLEIENTGSSCSSPSLRTEPSPFPRSRPMRTSGYNAPAPGDWDGDGDLDLFVGVLGGAFDANATLVDNFYFFEQTSDGFVKRTSRFLGTLDVGNESTTAWGDVDGDGDVDGLVANKIAPRKGSTSQVYLLENTGSASSPSLRRRGALDLPEAYHYAPALGDLNGDGRPDLLLGTWKGRIAYAQGDGSGSFSVANDALVQLEGGSNVAPALGDLDDDGDLDLIVGESDGTLSYYRNDGSPQEPSFTLARDDFAGAPVDNRSAPALGDVDGDGDLDVLVGSKADGFALIRNSGTPSSPAFEPAAAVNLQGAPRLATPAFADLDADGRPAIVSGTQGGGLVLFRPAGAR